MSQPRRYSLYESITQQAVGFVISVLLWEFVIKPARHLQTSFAENITITLLFMVVSIVRGYVFRRIFNRLHA